MKPFVFYLHPWEIDPDLPEVDNAGMLSKFRTYLNLDKTENRLKRLLSDFPFSSLSDIFSTWFMEQSDTIKLATK